MEESGLFELIKTLNKTEKRYFKKYADNGQKEGSHAVQLIDALEKPLVFDAEKFHRQNRTKPFYKNLASEKQQLMRVLLQSMNEYHRGNSVRKRMHFHLDSFELLFQKHQYRLCEKQLKKAGKLAQEYGHTAYQFEIYKSLGKLYQHSGNYKKMQSMLDEISIQQNEMTARLESEFKLKLIEFTSYATSRQIGYPRTKKDKNVYQKIMASGKSLARKNPSLNEKLSLLTIKNYYYDTLPDKQPLMKVRREWIETAEQHETFIADNTMQYLVSLNNLANSYDELGMEAELERTLKKINTHIPKNLDEEIRIFIYYYNLKLVRDINKGRFTDCITHFPEAEAGLNKFGRWFHPEYKQSFRYLFSYGYFGARKYKEALKWTHEMILNYPGETLEEYYNFARIFILLIYFELGHDGLLEFELRSAKRYFSKREKLFALEKTMLDFMRRSITPEGISVSRKDFTELKEKITQLKQSPYEQQLFSLFDWEMWAMSKVKGSSLEDCMQRKNA